MWASRAPLLQPFAISLPFTCRHAPVMHQKSSTSTTHIRRAHKDRAPNDLAFGRRLCSVGLLTGACGFIVAGGHNPFSPAPQVGSQVVSSPITRSQLGSTPVNAERVYDMEAKLQKSGFTEKQARALILAAACLRRFREKVSFDDVSTVFDISWQVEDDMLKAGFSNSQARQLGLMFVALASTKQDRSLRHSNKFWDFWEVEDASKAGHCLELAGAEQFKGFDLATTMLDFARQEWDS